MTQLTHLHVHSHYSILTATASPLELVKKAKELGMNHLALTDNSVTYGFIEFYKACKKEGIHPILGCDMNILPLSKEISSVHRGTETYQIVLLAENYEGYKNILKLSTKAHLEGFIDVPSIDHTLLKQYSKGLIALIGGFKSAFAVSLASGKEEEAEQYLKIYQKIFGKENIYLSLDHPLTDDQKKIYTALLHFGKKHTLSFVAAHPVFYVNPEDRRAHDIMLCIRDASIIHDDNRYKMEGDYSMADEKTMQDYFKDVPEALSNTEKIARRCTVEIPLGQSLIPKFSTPKGITEQKYLQSLCEKGLKKRYKKVTKELKERLEYELSIIHKMGFDAYFLIVWDFVAYAKNHGIMVGPGRGSAAGSIVAYTLEITDIDPIRFDLIFERFLNPERISMPDIDIDFIDTRRDEVIQYVQQKYGHDRVAQIITFGTMAARGAVRDCGRALGYPYGTVDRIAKAIPGDPGIKLQDALKHEVVLQEIYKEKDSKKIIDTALKLEGAIRNTSIHAAAVVISEDSLTETTALQKANKGEDSIVTQYSMKPIEDLGLLKMDFLGLKNLSILERALHIIKKLHTVDIDILNIPLEDKKTYQMLSRGETTGVFQFESAGMRRYLKELQPTSIEDLIAMVSLYRPGPMEYILEYIKGKHDPKGVLYLDPCLKPILSETYGIAVYQEQIQKIAQEFAGYSLGEADLLRRAVGKKIKEEVDQQKGVFIEKAIKNGKTKVLAEKLFSFIEPFARYGFNKAHAASYAMIAYQTAYLKANYPVEYMTALLTSDSGNADKILSEVSDCNRMGITVLPPSITQSYENFSVSPDGKSIRFGLAAIKNIGEGPSKAILDARKEKGTFTSFSDFVSQVDSKFINKKVLESLAKVGAFDEFAERNQVLENIDIIIDFSKQSHKNKDNTQIDLFDTLGNTKITELTLPEMVIATLDEKLSWEKELLGVYISSHPLDGLQTYLDKYTTNIASLSELKEETKVRIGGIITGVRIITTKAGQQMAFLQIEDQSAEIEGVIFPRNFEDVKDILEEGNIIVAEALITTRERNDEKIRSVIINKCRLVDLEKARKLKAKDDIHPVKVGQVNEKGIIKNPDSKKPVKHFTINIPHTADSKTLEQVKHILKQYPGDDTGKLQFSVDDNTIQNIDIPFGVDWNNRLEKEIKDFLEM